MLARFYEVSFLQPTAIKLFTRLFQYFPGFSGERCFGLCQLSIHFYSRFSYEFKLSFVQAFSGSHQLFLCSDDVVHVAFVLLATLLESFICLRKLSILSFKMIDLILKRGFRVTEPYNLHFLELGSSYCCLSLFFL